MKPILFNTEMVRAILEGRKIVTRRVIKVPDRRSVIAPVSIEGAEVGCLCSEGISGNILIAPYQVGDILYVRETWQKDRGIYYYKWPALLLPLAWKWRPSIHMPKEAARIFLRVTDVRVERLCDMKLADFLAEGISLTREELRHHDTALYKAREMFKDLWNSTCGKPHTPQRYANNFYANPYVWVIEFEVISKEEAQKSV